MMTLKAWLALLAFYVLYLLMGGFAFRAIEAPHNCDERRNAHDKSVRIYRKLKALQGRLNPVQNDLLQALMVEFNSSATMELSAFLMDDGFDAATVANCTDQDNKWGFFNSLFFSFTAITTIGFGHLSPETSLGKTICIVYSLLGVPINGILIGSLGAYFGSKLQKFMDQRPREAENSLSNVMILTMQVVFYLIFGCIIFIALPAVAFTFLEEDWTYLDSFYFAFITLTTIGFGDYVAGRDESSLEKLGDFRYVYLTLTIVWIIFGLGYVFMIIGVITDGLRAPARKAVKKLAKAEKAVIAKVLQEIVLIKSKEEEKKRKKAKIEQLHEDAPDVQLPASISNGFENAAYNPSPTRTAIAIMEAASGGSSAEGLRPQSKQDENEVDNEELIDEINHDTITSLHNFVETSNFVKRKTAKIQQQQLDFRAASIHGGETAEDLSRRARNASTSSRQPESSSRAASIHGGETENELRRGWLSRRVVPRKFSLRSVSSLAGGQIRSANASASGQMTAAETVLAGLSSYASKEAKKSGRKLSMSLPEILRETTLEEFLQAVERVQAADVMLYHHEEEANYTKTDYSTDNSQNFEEDISSIDASASAYQHCRK